MSVTFFPQPSHLSGGEGLDTVQFSWMYAHILLVASTQFAEVLGAGVPLTSPQLYSSCHTDDLRQALLYISYRYFRASLLGLGFSLGDNVLTR